MTVSPKGNQSNLSISLQKRYFLREFSNTYVVAHYDTIFTEEDKVTMNFLKEMKLY